MKTEGPKGLGIFMDQGGASSKEDGQGPGTGGDGSGSQVTLQNAKLKITKGQVPKTNILSFLKGKQFANTKMGGPKEILMDQGGGNSEDNGQGPDTEGDGSGSQVKQLSTSVKLEARDGLIRDPTCAHEWPKDSTHISCEARNTRRPLTCAGLTG